MNNKSLYRIESTNTYCCDVCKNHSHGQYILINSDKLKNIQEYLNYHDHYFSKKLKKSKCGYYIEFDFKKIFNNLTLIENVNDNILNFLSEQKLETTDFLLKLFKESIDVNLNSYVHRNCDCICSLDDQYQYKCICGNSY